jgi:G3E family GTPase
VITKTDLCEATPRALIDRLRLINPDANIHVAAAGNPNAATLLHDVSVQRSASLQSASGFYCDAPAALLTAGGVAHRTAIASFVITVDEPIDWTGFGVWLTMLLNRHGDRVLRVKGILGLAG